MKTDADWIEKTKKDWAKYRAEFEANIPDFPILSPEEVAQLQGQGIPVRDYSRPEEVAELRDERRRFMDYAEREHVGRTDSELMEDERNGWYMTDWLGYNVDSRSVRDLMAIEAVLESRGYDVHDMHKRWHAERAARVKALADAMIADGDPEAGMVRSAITEATNKETGEVNWAAVAEIAYLEAKIPTDDSEE